MKAKFNFDNLIRDVEKGGYKINGVPKRRYICIKCGVATYNNQIIGPHCHICWDELCNTIIKMPIQANLKRWLG